MANTMAAGRTVPYAPVPSFQSEPSSRLQMWMSRGSISQSLQGSAGSALLCTDPERARLLLPEPSLRLDACAPDRWLPGAAPLPADSTSARAGARPSA
jgi:hypothetical protein